MIKRTTAAIFVSLAGILMLVHAVVPHHHHYSEICFQKTHCENEQSTESENTPDRDHDSNNNDRHDVCVLNAPAVLPAGQDNHECKCISYTYKHAGAMFSITAILNSEQKHFIQDIKSDDSSQGIISISQLPDYSSVGLRAPPLV